ncbi:MAG: ornithine cyclodeaminase family protein [Vicinamibacteria bacterium]|nr:ornithine cyclodeaminase family protein [Vicinamibacteria bacterium]
MTSTETLLLSRHDVRELLTLQDCIDAVERAFVLAARGAVPQPSVLGFPTTDGGFHIKAAALDLGRRYFAAKLNGNFFRNRERFGMPNIQGVVVLCDAENGLPLAVLDSIEITILRSGAATGVAARALSRPDSRVVTLCGCGNQGRVSLRALKHVLALEKAYLWDVDPRAAAIMADEMKSEVGPALEVVADFKDAARVSDIVVTCTPSKQAFLGVDDVRPGAFIAAVGADNEEKHEIEPALMAAAKVVTDVTAQAADIGDLHHAIRAGVMSLPSVHAELGEVVGRLKPGRESDDEIIIFDSTGTALQDVAAAALVYERARSAGRGSPFRFSE